MRNGAAYPYEPRCWWFAVVELIRRLYLTGLLAFFGSDEEPTSMTQTSMGLLGAIIYFIVLAHFNPYYDSADELLSKVAAVQVVLTFFGATVLQAKDNSKDSEAGDPNGVYAGPVFAGVCVSVGLVTLVFALYLFLSEVKTYASKTRVGRQLSSSVDAATNYAKKRIRRIGSSEKAAKESTADPESSPTSPLARNEPPHEDEEQPVVLTG